LIDADELTESNNGIWSESFKQRVKSFLAKLAPCDGPAVIDADRDWLGMTFIAGVGGDSLRASIHDDGSVCASVTRERWLEGEDEVLEALAPWRRPEEAPANAVVGIGMPGKEGG
jgi:hypothetical protein